MARATPLCTVLQQASGVLNRSPRGDPHESYSADGGKASPLALTYSQFESIPSYDFLGIFTSHKAKGRCGRLKGKRGRGTSADEKNPVFGMVERGGLVCLRVLPNVKQQTIKPLIKSCVSQGATFYTDEYNIYNKLEGWGYTHKVVNHGQGEYARDEDGMVFMKFIATHSKAFGRFCVVGYAPTGV